VLNRYLGYWDGNPATVAPLSPADSAPLYVEMMGGADKILARGSSLYDEGQYRLAMEIINKLVYAQPRNAAAKSLLADIFEQLGYQYESSSMRNSFLSAAQELRSGIAGNIGVETGGADTIGAVTKAEGIEFRLNFITPDNGENLVIEMSNGTLTNIIGFVDPEADATITIDRADLLPVMMQQTTLAAQIMTGKAQLEGNGQVIRQLMSTLVVFDPMFEMMPGTGLE